MTTNKPIAPIAAVTLVYALCPLTASAITCPSPNTTPVTGVTVEAVSNYGGVGNIDCYNQGNGFMVGMTGTGSPFTQSTLYYDNNVYDTDFLDPDYSGNTADNDTYNFDSSGSSIGFVCAHGTCDDATSTACTTSSNCIPA